jgi:hypothetical protein
MIPEVPVFGKRRSPQAVDRRRLALAQFLGYDKVAFEKEFALPQCVV